MDGGGKGGEWIGWWLVIDRRWEFACMKLERYEGMEKNVASKRSEKRVDD